ncbi:hypothetical protein Droror1_Dr00021597 [Drosera rotundifolia]
MDQPDDECRNGGKRDDEEAAARLEELKRSMDTKMALRQSNLNPERPDPAFLRTLDSSIKHNTTVIKKLKQISEEQKEGLMDELRTVNMSKFVSEAVAAICDCKLKTSDIQAAVQVCSLLHQRYQDFSTILIQSLSKIFTPGKNIEDLETDRNTKAVKKRSTLRLLLELFFVGVIEDSNIFINVIKDLTGTEQLKDRDIIQTNLSLLSTFAKQGRIFLGLPFPAPDANEEIFKVLTITADQKKFFKKAVHTYYDSALEILQSEHNSLRQLEQENAKILNAKGELSDENASLYEKLRKSYDNLFRGVSSLAEALDMQPPIMPEDYHTTRLTSGDDAGSPVAGNEPPSPEPVWDDEDTRAFYESLPDLRAFVPAVLLGEAEPKVNELSTKAQEQATGELLDIDQGQEATDEDLKVAAKSGSLPDDAKSNEQVKDNEGKGKEKDKEKEDKDKAKDADKEKGKEKDMARKGESDKEKVKGVEGTTLDALLQRLPGCVSRDLIDQLTVEFCYVNSKSSRKKLVRALFNVPRTSLELLPYYSRMVATLSTCMKDISIMLLQMLEEEFNFLMNKKDQMNIETKIRNIRFLGELCKFKVAASGFIFNCLKACLDDFSHHNIDVACNLLETCGRFLYRSPETATRMGNMLDILMRLKNVKNLDPRHSTLVENAYYLCKPPDRPARVAKSRPPLYQYARKLIFSDLDKWSIEHVLRQLRKLPWTECEPYLLKCFLKVHRGKYGQIHLIASLTAGLSRYHDEFAVAVVDEVLEKIRLGLELNDYDMQQRRLAYMRLLGELYNYELVDSSLIFETLYLMLAFGHGPEEQDVLDPPEDFFRARLVITLLETCGHYFGRGSSKRKLDNFLMHFQRYILGKGLLPLDIEFDLQDLFADLRPSMKRYTSFEYINKALAELEEHEHKASQKHLDADKSMIRSDQYTLSNGRGFSNGIEGNGSMHEDAIGECETDSGSGTIGPEGHDLEDELDDENHDDVAESGDEEDLTAPPSEEDDEVHVRLKVSAVHPEEAAEFDRELKALMQESLESRKLELRARPTINMTIPVNLLESSKDHHGRASEGESGDDPLDDDDDDDRGSKEVRVKVLVKRGHKQQTKEMYIPQDSSLVRSTKQKEAAELEEKQDIKRLVLEYNDREEEDVNGVGGGQSTGWVQSGFSRTPAGRGSGSWDGSSAGKGSGSRNRFYYQYSGAGSYYSRKK